jgi:MYXO-CTERM domain-containing protein
MKSAPLLASVVFVFAQVGVVASAWAELPAPASPTAMPASPTGAQAEAPLTPETMATAEKPKGFRYSVIQDGIVDDLSGTILYVKASKDAKTTSATPVPMDRTLLAKCVTGGTVDDLVKGAVVTVKFDPRGVVRPEITVQSKPEVEVLEGAKVVDRGGNKLYVVTKDGQQRGFALEGGAAAWDTVVSNGKADDLKPGTAIRVEFDPSGRLPLKVALLQPVAAVKDKGCGCSVRAGARPVPVGAWLLAGLALGFWGWRRRAA